MALTNFAASSPDAPAADVDSIETGCVVGMGAVRAKEAANVEGTIVEIVGMTFVDVVAISLSFNWIKVFNSFFVSLN